MNKYLSYFLTIVFSGGGWAPILVLILHKIVMVLGVRSQSDWLMHYLGGLAITYFCYRIILLHKKKIGSLNKFVLYSYSFCSGCTIALFWDLFEFASDQILGTDIQHSLIETMFDLTYGVLGAITVLLFLCLKELKMKLKKYQNE